MGATTNKKGKGHSTDKSPNEVFERTTRERKLLFMGIGPLLDEEGELIAREEINPSESFSHRKKTTFNVKKCGGGGGEGDATTRLDRTEDSLT